MSPSRTLDDNAYDAAARMLLRRPHAENELTLKLARKGFAQEDITAALEQLKTEGHVNDIELARMLVRWHIEQRPSGRRAVVQRLRLKGLSREHIALATADLLTPDVERSCARRALNQRLRHTDLERLPAAKRRDRLARFLLGRGFDTEDVLAVLEALDAPQHTS